MKDLLNDWVTQPAPPTAVHTPQSLRKRIAQLIGRQLRRAVDATMAAHDISASATRDALEMQALREHQLLWAMPALLTRRMPDQGAPDRDLATKPSRAEGIQRLKQQRARIQKGEQGMWSDLLQEALHERERRTDDWKTPSRLDTPEITKRRAQEAAARKAKNGCLKSAAQLLLSEGPREPPTLATVQATWDVIAPEPPEPHMTQQAFQRARQHAKLAPYTSIRKRTLARCIRGLRLGAEPGPSGWRNGLWIDLLQTDDGLDTALAWVNLWTGGKVSSPVAALWQRSTVIGLPKPRGGIRPITLQESCTKLVEAALCQHWDKAIRRALGPHQMGAGSAANAQLALECLRAVARHEDTAEMCSTDIANAFGTLHRERVLEALETDAPFLLPYFVSAWDEAGSVLWTRGPNGWHQHVTRRGVPQGSPLSAILFALAFGTAVREGLHEHQTPNLAYADDLTVWGTKPGELSKSWDSLTAALSKSGLEMKPSKCTAWRPHDPGNSEPVIPGIKVDTGLIVLGSPAVDGSEMPLGAPKLDESNLANDPTTVRADKACKLAKSITDMAHAMVDKCGAHAATVLLQRVVCPSLDYDLRARADKHVATQQRRVHDAVFQSLAAITRRELGPEQQNQIALPADMGGCAIRSPNRKGAGVAARWAALSDTLPRAQRALEELGYSGCWKQAQQELEDVTSELCNFGVVVCDGTPVVDPRLHDVIASCLPPRTTHCSMPQSHRVPQTMHAADCKGKLAKPLILSL